MTLVIPEHAGITEIRHLQVDDGVLVVVRPGAPAIEAVRDVLCLARAAAGVVLLISGIDRDKTVGLWLAESAGVFAIDDHAARKDHDAVFFWDRDRQLFPVQQVLAHAVSPTHVSPDVAKRVVLEEEVILAVVKDKAV